MNTLSQPNFRLKFIRAKYFGKDMGVPELAWYVNVETPLDPMMEGTFPFEDEELDCGEVENAVGKSAGRLTLEPVKSKSIMKPKGVTGRRISVSSSESDMDIGEVLKEVVRDYTATHSRTERAAECQENIRTKNKGKDLIWY
jgi:hypothetical protein